MALGSAEAELYGLVRASSEAIGLASLHKDLGTSLRCTVMVDASAAFAIVARQGVGRVRHLDTPFLWVQDTSMSGAIKHGTIDGTANGADLFSKSMPWFSIEMHSGSMNVELLQSNSSAGYTLQSLSQNPMGIGVGALEHFHKELAGNGPLRVCRRVGLGVCTSTTSMNIGPHGVALLADWF